MTGRRDAALSPRRSYPAHGARRGGETEARDRLAPSIPIRDLSPQRCGGSYLKQAHGTRRGRSNMIVTDWQALHGLTGADYQHAFDEMVGGGYRLVKVAGAAQGGDARYT